jgi:hypothetical protein
VLARTLDDEHDAAGTAPGLGLVAELMQPASALGGRTARWAAEVRPRETFQLGVGASGGGGEAEHRGAQAQGVATPAQPSPVLMPKVRERSELSSQ